MSESISGLNGDVARTVLIVEDDDAIRLVLRTNLEDESYRVLEAASAEKALEIMVDESPDALLVDLRLPGLQGIELVRALRLRSQVPIIVVSAQTDSHDVVAGLEAGADDYVTKPFVSKELMARLRTVFRRISQPEEQDHELVCGPIVLRSQTAEVIVSGESKPVSRIECDVLAELISAGGKVLSRDYLLRNVWGYGNAGDGRVVDNLIYRLRVKLEKIPGSPQHLLTVRGFGYRLVE